VDVDVLFARELAARGYQIDFIMQSADGASAGGEARWHGCRVLVGRTNSGRRFHQRLHKHWLGLRHQLACLSRISSRSHDAIQVRDEILIAAIAAPAARLLGLKFFYWLSFPISETQVLRGSEGTARYPLAARIRGTVAQLLLYGWIMRLSDHIFVQSEQMKRDVMARGIAAEKLTAVPMGIASADLRPPRAAPQAAAATVSAMFQVGYLGTLNAHRRLDVLIDALALLRKGGVDARMIFVGDGEGERDRHLLIDRAEELGVGPYVEITGFLPRAEALDRISAVDVAVSPFFPTYALRSTSPTKLVEYFALGLPVVANDHPEQRLVLHQSSAGICVPWGARHFAKAIRRLMLAPAACRHTLGERGRQWVMHHRTYARIADELSGVYQRVGAWH
jgi:glycosyltransferase involved in cell wall biosynthesis